LGDRGHFLFGEIVGHIAAFLKGGIIPAHQQILARHFAGKIDRSRFRTFLGSLGTSSKSQYGSKG
jgi:hypothetical protein